MPVVSFGYVELLVSLRRRHAPRAVWNGAEKSWDMTAEEATAFLEACRKELEQLEKVMVVTVDGEKRELGRRPVPPPPAETVHRHAGVLIDGKNGTLNPQASLIERHAAAPERRWVVQVRDGTFGGMEETQRFADASGMFNASTDEMSPARYERVFPDRDAAEALFERARGEVVHAILRRTGSVAEIDPDKLREGSAEKIVEECRAAGVEPPRLRTVKRLIDTGLFAHDTTNALRRYLRANPSLGREERLPLDALIDAAERKPFDAPAFARTAALAYKSQANTCIGYRGAMRIIAEMIFHAFRIHRLSEEDVPELAKMIRALRTDAAKAEG
jgi:hypothetical protein